MRTIKGGYQRFVLYILYSHVKILGVFLGEKMHCLWKFNGLAQSVLTHYFKTEFILRSLVLF
jgi:hypothetical protein